MNLLSVKAVVLSVGVIGGGLGAAYSAGMIGKPEVSIDDKGDWIADEEIKVESSAVISNPNPLGLNLSSFNASYSLKMNGVNLAEGAKKDLRIPKNTNRTIRFTTTMNTGNIEKWWVSHLRNGEVSELRIPIDAYLKLGPLPISGGYTYNDEISTNLESILSESLSKIEGEYSRSLGPESGLEANKLKIGVLEASARFGSVNSETTELIIPMKIENSNDYAIPTPQLDGKLNLNNITLAKFDANNVRSPSDTNIPPGETREIKIVAEMSNKKIDEWFESHIRKKEKTDAELSIRFGFDVGGATVNIPSNEGMVCEFDFATKILADEKQDTKGFQGCSGFIKDSDESDDSDGLLGDGEDDSSTPKNDSTENDSGLFMEVY